MAVYHPYPVRCVCGKEFIAHLANSVNATRNPAIKEKIIDGSFHKKECPHCERKLTIEKEFSYTDLNNNIFIKVMPPGQRHTWKKASAMLDEEVQRVPQKLLNKEKPPVYRVVFGLTELKEKILAEKYDYDDRAIELLKVLVMYEHPVLMQKARLRLSLMDVNDDDLEFLACYDHDKKRYQVRIPAQIAKHTFRSEDEIKNWVKRNHKHSNIFEMKSDYWVNIWRWSPQTTALNALKEYAEQVQNKEDVNLKSKAFSNMLSRLPRGNHLPPWAKKDLRTLFKYAETKNAKKQMDSIFEIRFNKELDDDWSYNNKPQDIDTIWQLLQDLPDTHVEGNTRIDEISLSKGGGGSYDSDTDTISMGAKDIGDRKYFEDTMRHEVGHAVHEMNNDLVNGWLNDRFGWQMIEADDNGIEEWVKLMGGWGKFTAKERGQIKKRLLQMLGEGEVWLAPTVDKIPATHPWNNKNCHLRMVCDNNQQPGGEWFKNYKNWHSYKDKAFFINYYYRTLCVINKSTLDMVPNMPSEYSAMSPFEFFAELYAVHYNHTHPLRKKIPKDVKEWMDKNLG